MNLACPTFRARQQQGGWALLAVMTLAACGLMLLASVMSWANENATVAARNNEYFATSYAAESATEKVLALLSQQYENYQFALVNANMATYITNLPNASDNAYWNSYQFSGGHSINQIIVTNTATAQSVVEGAPYTGLTLEENTYEIIANAMNTTTGNNIVATVGQQVYLGTIPLFQFAIFYQNDMEIAPGAPMTISGLVHGNAHIYLEGQAGMTIAGTVSAVDQVIIGEDPLDPSARTLGPISFNGFPPEQNNVNPLNLPVGTNTTGTVSNTSQNVYAILQPPMPGQSPTSSTGTNLLYNQADLIVVISNNNTISVTSGAKVNNQATVIPQAQWQTFLSTNGGFYDQRDALSVQPITIDVSNLMTWSAANTNLRPVLSSLRGGQAADVESIYVDDQRNTSSNSVNPIYATTTTLPHTYFPPVTTNKYLGYTTGYTYVTGYTTNPVTIAQPGVVLTNGAVLPPNGLSIATPDPAYIAGNWNVQNSTSAGAPSDAGLADTSHTLPSAIFADAITILSPGLEPGQQHGVPFQPARRQRHGQRRVSDRERSVQRHVLQRRGGKLSRVSWKTGTTRHSPTMGRWCACSTAGSPTRPGRARGRSIIRPHAIGPLTLILPTRTSSRR